MVSYLDKWHGSMDMKSIAATVYNRWYIEFSNSLLKKYKSDASDLMSITRSYAFTDFF
jgi:acyl-homoserine lactone acylase PvdQ